MPYKLKKLKDGYKVCKADDMNNCFSNKPITKKKAIRQMKAIGISESKKTGGNIKKISNQLKNAILGGQKQILENQIIIEKTPELISELKLLREQVKDIDKLKTEIEDLKAERADLLEQREQKQRRRRTLEEITVLNLFKEFRKNDENLIQFRDADNEVISAYDVLMSDEASDKPRLDFKLQKHQKEFIKDWAMSAQENVILYYGVGSGKTIIAINCGEQYLELNPDGYVYFLTPASLVLNTIKEMMRRGIDPRRKNSQGIYQYNFVSYQQLLYSQFDFKPNSCLIVDEAHNLRNIRSVAISEKISARKRQATGNYSIIGNVLAEKLITMPVKFVRSIFMTGTLFVNGPEDIESIISLGFKKRPLLNFEEDTYFNMLLDNESFKKYYNGLISYYRQNFNDPNYPKKNYIF